MQNDNLKPGRGYGECIVNMTVWMTVLGLSLAISGCGRQAEPPKAQPRFVLTETVQIGAAAAMNQFAGEVRARHEVPLAFRVGGKLATRAVEVGEPVQAGQVLAQLDPADLRQSQQGAEADLAAVAAELRLARLEVERTRSLKASGFVSQAALDSKETVLRAAEEKHTAAQSRAGLARNQSAYAVLRADVAGVIAQVLAEPGQVLAAGQPVVRLAQHGEKEVVISVPEGRVAEFALGRMVRLRFWALPGKTFAGRVREMAPQADALTRTFAVRVSLTEAAPGVRLGMSAEVGLEAGGGVTSLRLPATAIFQKNRQPAVWVLKDGKVHLRPVEVAQWREDAVEIRAGLQAGETVVSAGANKLVEGEAVTAIERATEHATERATERPAVR